MSELLGLAILTAAVMAFPTIHNCCTAPARRKRRSRAALMWEAERHVTRSYAAMRVDEDRLEAQSVHGRNELQWLDQEVARGTSRN